METLTCEVERRPAISFFLLAESFLSTAQFTHEASASRALALRFDQPIYYLYSHGLELLLKSFLRAAGITAKVLAGPKFGHKMPQLWAECLRHGLSLGEKEPHVSAVIAELAPFAASYEFRYVEIGFRKVIALEEVLLASKALLHAIRPAANASITCNE